MNAEKVAREIVEAFGQHNLCKCNNCLAVLTKALNSFADERIERSARVCETHCDEETGIHIKRLCVLCRTAEAIRKLKSGG